MSELKMGIGETDEWYTPPEIFRALNCTFDLDPCSSGNDHVPAHLKYTKVEDGLARPWHGMVWMNPPFGGRNGHVPWLAYFVDHGSGIGLCRAYTSAGWFHDWMPKMDGLLFPRGKTKFIKADGSIGKSPSSGIALFSKGEEATEILHKCDLGMFFRQPPRGMRKDPQ